MKINVQDKKKVTDIIKSTEKGTSARQLEYHTLENAITQAEKKLYLMSIPKKNWAGCFIVLEPPKVVNSYQGISKGTWATLSRGNNAWFLTECRRGCTGNRSYGEEESFHLHVCENAKRAIPATIKIY